MNGLDAALRSLGDRLDLDDIGLVDDVLLRLDEPTPGRRARPERPWLAVAAIAAAIVVGALILPSSRSAIADWFGLDGVRIERDPDLSVPADAPRGLPDGIVVDEFDGRLDPGGLTKVLAGGSDIRRVDVHGHPGLWIGGEPHELVVRDADGAIVHRRFAGNTLLWQDGDVIHRIEGAATLPDALALASGD